MPNVKAQISNQLQIPNVKASSFWNLKFFWHLDFEI
jgi:hypothetical protein